MSLWRSPITALTWPLRNGSCSIAKFNKIRGIRRALHMRNLFEDGTEQGRLRCCGAIAAHELHSRYAYLGERRRIKNCKCIASKASKFGNSRFHIFRSKSRSFCSERRLRGCLFPLRLPRRSLWAGLKYNRERKTVIIYKYVHSTGARNSLPLSSS